MQELSEELQSFILETVESLTDFDQDVLGLEAGFDESIVDRVFRTLHTIKGTSSFLDLPKIERLAHASEHLMVCVRERSVILDRRHLTLVLRSIDWLREALDVVRATGNDVSMSDPKRLIASLQEAAASKETSAPPEAASDAPREPIGTRASAPALQDTTIRVDVRRLDRFMNNAGELVLVRNQILRQIASGRMPSTETLQQLSSVATRMHDSAMQVRMQPIARLWRSLPRVVHDLAQSLDKEADLVLEGGETELDRAVVEAIRDPLVHAVRNALDHGIETPDVRAQTGKARRGRLLLRAWHADGQIHVVIEDDGAGIDFERVRGKAIERGLLDASGAEAATEQELVELLFQPGFSTSASVTRVSGRGVGMDVVRSSLQRVGGSVQLSSRLGAGSRLLMTMPLTLAIGSALIVRTAGQCYAIPQSSIAEVARITKLESFHGFPVFRLRGQLVPLVRLKDVLECADETADSPRVAVVVRGDGRSFGLAVDEILDMQEIVIKPLPPWLRCARTFVGLTILGDGGVAVVLDTAALGRRGHVAGKGAVQPHASESTTDASGSAETQEFVLLVRDGDGGYQALQMRDVIRVEQLDRAAIQQVERRPAIEYEGGFLLLVELSRAAAEPDQVNVVVARCGERRVGILVEEIVDIARAVRREGESPDGHPVVVANGRLAPLCDVAELCERNRMVA